MKYLSRTILLIMVITGLIACTASPNALESMADAEGTVAGFWLGLWQGFIALFAFIVSLFNDNVGVYEAHNNGGWYNFGFILGVMMFFGGSNEGGKRAYSQR